jgi:uncharacterized protein (UPF0332 family)
MTDDKATPFLEKAQEALRAARILLEQGCPNSAANRAYYAAFHVSRAALVAAGISSPDRAWSHEAIPGGLSQLIHRKKVYPAHLLRDLWLLLEVRLVADYRPHQVSSREASRVVKKAELFVVCVAREIQS